MKCGADEDHSERVEQQFCQNTQQLWQGYDTSVERTYKHGKQIEKGICFSIKSIFFIFILNC